MRRSQTATVIAVEKLVEPNIVPKMWVRVELLVPSVGRTTTIHIAPEDVNESVLDLLGDLGKIHIVAAACWAFYFEITAVVLVEALQGLDQQKVDRELKPSQ
jgi:hypothetical protein